MSIQEQFYKSIEDGDIENFNLLMKNKEVNPADDNNKAIVLASRSGHFDIVKLLLNDKRVNPSDCYNSSIIAASDIGYFDIVNLLWQDQKVKDTLKIDDKELYNELIKNDIKDKIEDFWWKFYDYIENVKLILKDKKVNPSLKEDYFELYEILIEKDKIQNKIKDFLLIYLL